MATANFPSGPTSSEELPLRAPRDVAVTADGVVLACRPAGTSSTLCPPRSATCRLTDHMVEIDQRPMPKVPTCSARKTVVNLFFEDSTRLAPASTPRRGDSAPDVMKLRGVVQQRQQGREPARHDETVAAMGVDAFRRPYGSSRAPELMTRWNPRPRS